MAQADEMDGLRVVMSAPQLAAVLAHRSISPTEMMSNRLWGGLDIVGGVLEMVGAGVLCIAPEPTGVTKAGCIAFGMHGADTAWRGMRQAWTGHDTATLTQQGATKLAETMRAPPDMAGNIGLSLDIGVGFGLAGMLKAARVASITAGRIYLVQHEAKSLKGPGGHTIAKHVGKTEAQLRARLMQGPRLTAASSFTDLRTAEFAISEALRAHSGQIKTWAAGYGAAKLRFDAATIKPVGKVVLRTTGRLEDARKVRVVLLREQYNGMPYFVLTAFPIS
ncbi:RNase A-like domain-containing protein [Cupriavidus campinensis]|jgi:hypothetical protein|uniref:Bacterial CdiA-CT RNAse A domain-containing protein n=2 Tax=Cupriavidus TaxID=106589 RepID=A0AAE9L0S6_9BURK|nr:RNase A-like domain-containing protein [Cupriavidus campinensis]URF04242.1 hypothetical protein M5D45_17525 [Cupriavidus campinensis]